MYVACSTLCFADHPLDEALKTIREMNFAKADITLDENGKHLKPSGLTGDLTKISQKLRSANLPFAALHAVFGRPDGTDIRQQFRCVCRLARLLTVPVVSVQAAPIGGDMDLEVSRLQQWVDLAILEGVILTVETNAKTLTADAATTLELCRRVPGLGLTLDPSHYITAGQDPTAADSLFRYVRHVRLRDSAAAGDFQVRVGQGDVEYGRIITQLDRYRYDRALTVDVRATPSAAFPIEPEVRKLKFLLESLV